MAKRKLLDLVSSLKPYKKADWTARLKSDAREEVESLRKEFRAGTLKDSSGSQPSIAELHRLVCQEYGNVIGKSAFVYWMGR